MGSDKKAMESGTHTKQNHFSTSGHNKLLEDLIASMDEKQTSRPVQWRNIPITRINNNSDTQMNHQRSFTQEAPLQAQKQPSKRVTWSENLLDIRNISPRHSQSQNNFKFPEKPSKATLGYISHSGHGSEKCSHFICGVGQPCRLKNKSSSYSSSNPSKSTSRSTTTQLNCSPQLQKVVYRAVNADRGQFVPPAPTGKGFQSQEENNPYDWKPNRNNLTLNFHGDENGRGRKI